MAPGSKPGVRGPARKSRDFGAGPVFRSLRRPQGSTVAPECSKGSADHRVAAAGARGEGEEIYTKSPEHLPNTHDVIHI